LAVNATYCIPCFPLDSFSNQPLHSKPKLSINPTCSGQKMSLSDSREYNMVL
jgi:hypothetical protein